MKQVADGIYRLGGKRHNFYLITEGGRATVVDAGGRRELPRLEKALASCGMTLDDVEALLITHAHTDHIGFARAMEERGISVKVHEDEAAYAMDASVGSQIGMGDAPLWQPRVIAFLAELLLVGAEKARRLKNVETIVDGEELDIPGRPRVVATPGHTSGHASYLFADRQALCSGDTLVTNGIVKEGLGPQLLADVFHHDAQMVRASLDRLVGLEADVLLPGHGPAWRGSIADAVDLARG